MSLVLVIGAGLFVRTVNNLRGVDIGFNANNLLMFTVNPGLNRYDADRSRALFHQLQDELKARTGRAIRRADAGGAPLRQHEHEHHPRAGKAERHRPELRREATSST